MKTRIPALILALACAALAFTGCTAAAPAGASSQAQPASSDTGASDAVTFTDALDRTVTIEGTPRRVVALIGSFADVWCLAGGKDTLVAAADDTWTQFDLGLPDTVANLGSTTEPNLETILAAEPDLVLGSTKTAADVDLLPTFEAAGIPVAYFNISTFEDYLAMLEICTRLTGRANLYEENGTAIQQQIADACALAEGKEGPSVLYLRASGSSCKVKNSENTVLGEMLADLGCTNIADSETSLLENLSMEVILQADPDSIFIVLQGSDPAKPQKSLEEAVLSNPAWQQLTAVKEGRVYYMDQRLYNVKPNALWGQAYQELAEILYGE